MRSPSTTSTPGPQPSPEHDAAVIALLKGKRAQIQKQVATHLHHIDLLVGVDFHLAQDIARIEQRSRR